jgi:predicted glycogen debranching enzyme
MSITFGREICSHLPTAESREWLVTNGIGGYASGTVAGLLTRRYHGLLIAALRPPLGRTLLLTKLDETVSYNNCYYPLYTNRWADQTMGLKGFENIEYFSLEGSIPVWRFACADALIEKRIWMQQGANTTYICYRYIQGSDPLTIGIKALVNYRDYHHLTRSNNWEMEIKPADSGVVIKALPLAEPFYLLTDSGEVEINHDWYRNFDLATERYRGLDDIEDHLHAATFRATLQPGSSLTVVASTENHPSLDSEAALKNRQNYENKLIVNCLTNLRILQPEKEINSAVKQLILASDQFIVDRPTPDNPQGKTIIAGYPWFSDWGRDTMISLPGLTLATGRFDIARSILMTYANYVSQGMLPNRFPDLGDEPEYNTVDATLWYFEAIRAYYEATEDETILEKLFPILADIIDWHLKGTRYNIKCDPADGLLSAGEAGTQLTWMDAKVNNIVVTPRQGKPVEINALWYHALQIMAKFAAKLGKPDHDYLKLAQQTAKGFNRFWYETGGYCYDVIDTPHGDDPTLRPNQIFAISLPPKGNDAYAALLTPKQEYQVVNICAKLLLTSHGLRSLSPSDAQYCGTYGGDQYQRDIAYHQGTVWGWLIGPFARAHLRVYQNPAQVRNILTPMIDSLSDQGIGTLGEIADGDAPMNPRGCIAQAWSVAEVLRTLLLVS